MSIPQKVINDPDYSPKYANSYDLTRHDNVLIFSFYYVDVPSSGDEANRKLVSRVAMQDIHALEVSKGVSIFLNDKEVQPKDPLDR